MQKNSRVRKLMFAIAAIGTTSALSACYYDPGYYGPPNSDPGYRGRRGDFPGDRDNNPPGPRGGRGTNWENPPGPRGGPGTNWENPPGPRGGPGASPDRRRW